MVAFSADTLGSHYVGGFVEGVGTSLRKCRSCWCIGADMYLKVFFVIAIILITNVVNLFNKLVYFTFSLQQSNSKKEHFVNICKFAICLKILISIVLSSQPLG